MFVLFSHLIDEPGIAGVHGVFTTINQLNQYYKSYVNYFLFDNGFTDLLDYNTRENDHLTYVITSGCETIGAKWYIQETKVDYVIPLT